MIRAVCPNDPTHDTFLAVVYLSQVWRLSEHGDLYGPQGDDKDFVRVGDPWRCETCGAIALKPQTY